VSSPWEVPEAPINEAIRAAENWLAEALGQRIKWNRVRVIDSQRSLSEWRAGQIGLIKKKRWNAWAGPGMMTTFT
jgi:hypothetical protein